jgi:hypothetical protein
MSVGSKGEIEIGQTLVGSPLHGDFAPPSVEVGKGQK